MKKIIICVVFAVAMGTSAFSMDSEKDNTGKSHPHSIFVNFSPEIVNVEKIGGAISVTPKTDKLVINYEAYSEFDSHFLNITLSTEDIISPHLDEVRNKPLLRVFCENPTQRKVRTDFTIDNFVSTDSYHIIHNNGYLIAGNKQTYVNSTFAFEPNGGIKLNPSSQMALQFQQNDPLTSTIFGLISTHLNPNSVYSAHQGTVNPNCSISSITARPLGGIKRESSIHGTISYGDSFSMYLFLQGVALEFQPNNGFQFAFLG